MTAIFLVCGGRETKDRMHLNGTAHGCATPNSLNSPLSIISLNDILHSLNYVSRSLPFVGATCPTTQGISVTRACSRRKLHDDYDTSRQNKSPRNRDCLMLCRRSILLSHLNLAIGQWTGSKIRCDDAARRPSRHMHCEPHHKNIPKTCRM
ncbi:hypothetical protein I7I48_04411 [Histoplasma ohiense]|nr:hypothetical protein I7I48_04411 [Histoplasma ohiense (nom. inval.)]